jgi:hypothetical protein
LRKLLPALFALPVLLAQTAVPVLAPNTALHDHYLFNGSWTYDSQDHTGLPWNFYYANASSSPSPTTLRTRCSLEPVNGAPYGHVDFGWFRYPVPGGTGAWPPADGTEPLAATGEYLETSQFGPMDSASPAGFVFEGEFAGETNPPSPQTQDQYTHYFVEAVYFTDRECSDAGAEYGWQRLVAHSVSGETPPDSVTFYYSIFNNCNDDYACWDILGHQVHQQSSNTTVTSLAPNLEGLYEYQFRAIRSGSNFDVSVLDPSSGNPVNCDWSTSNGGSGSGACRFQVPVESWFPPADQIAKGYIVLATQSSHLYPSMEGRSYPEWYDYAAAQLGGTPPTNVVPTHEPNGTQSCLYEGLGFACLKAISLEVLYQ